MKIRKKIAFTLLFTVTVLSVLAINVFGKSDEIRYSLEPTITPLRIFFAVLVIVLFVAAEILFEKIRNNQVEKRNKNNKK